MPQAQTLISINQEDRDRFKIIAAQKKKTMKALFHEWLEEYDGEPPR
jgi:hypothetical protein